MMRNTLKRFAAWVLCLSMVIGFVPGSSFVIGTQAAEGSQKFDFTTNAGIANPRNATIEAQGWRIHPTLTAKKTYTDIPAWLSCSKDFTNALVMTGTNNIPVDSDIAIEFKVEETGEYFIDFEYFRTSAGVETDVYLDDVKIGSVSFYASNTTGPVNETFGDSIFAFEGGSTHVFTLRRTSGSDYCMYLTSLTITKAMDIAISGPSAIKKGESAQLKVLDRTGKPITSAVDFSVEPEGIISVDADGNITALEDGAVEIIAEAEISGEVMVSAPFSFKVISGAGKSQIIDFRGTAGANPRDVRIVDKNWEINKKNTSVGAYTTYPQWIGYLGSDGLSVYIPKKDGSVESDLAFDINVLEDGVYNIDFEYVRHAAGNIADVYLDGAYMGEVDFYASSITYGGKTRLTSESIALASGKHTFVIRRTNKNNFECFYPSAIVLRPLVTSIAVECASAISVGKGVKLGAVDQSGNLIEDDVTYQVSDRAIAYIDESGSLVGLSGGTVEVTASAVIDGESFVSEPKAIIVIEEEGEYQKVDFRGDINSEIRDAIISVHGFEINKEKTSKEVYNYAKWLEWEEYGFTSYIPAKDTAVASDIAVDFNVNKTGIYILELEYMINAAGNDVDLFLDGEYIGNLDFYSTTAVLNRRKTFNENKLALLEGRHTLTFRRTSRNKFECIYPSAIVLRPPQKVKLYSDKYNMVYGETAKLSLAGPWFENPETAPTFEDIYFESSDLSVLEVDAQGNVTAKNEGTANINVTVKKDGKSDYDSVEISVTDNTPIVSAYLSGDSIVYVNNQSNLKLDIMRESGDLLDASKAYVDYRVIECEPVNAITVGSDGKVSATAVGAAKIMALVIANGVIVESNEITVSSKELVIKEGVYEDQIFDFRNNQSGEPEDASINSHGWQMVREKSNPGLIDYPTWFSYSGYGMMIYTPSTTAPDSDLTLDVAVRADGIYRGEFEFLHDEFESTYSIYVDGKFMGSVDTYSQEAPYTQAEPVSLNSIYLEKGVHRVTFRFNEGHPYLFMSAFRLLTVDDPKEAEMVANAEKEVIAVGEVINAEAAITENGMPVKFGKGYNGSTDDYVKVTLSDSSVIAYDEVNRKITALKEGICTVAVEGKYGDIQGRKSFTVTVDNSKLGSVSVVPEKENLYQGESVKLNVNAYTENGRDITDESIAIAWSSSDENVARVENGSLICVNPGEVDISFVAQMGENTITGTVALTVEGATGSSLIIDAGSRMIKLASKGIQIKAKGKLTNGLEVDVENVTYENHNPEIVSVSRDGFVSPVAQGKATITVSAEIAGVICGEDIEFMVTVGKTAPTIYTEEKVAIAIENASTYSWAKSERNSAVNAADRYLRLGLDAIWETVTTQGLMRNANPGHRDDPTLGYCYYCGANLKSKYGHYPWIINALNNPWKIQCPECRRRFPSNDFGSFYKLGIDEKGNWDYNKALAENRKLVDAGQDGYLKNIMYPEAKSKFGDENWGVDDGFGYDAGNEFKAGFTEKHQYIAYYNLWGVWYNGANMYTSGAIIPAMLTSFMNAYLYTGDIKYGRAGAILIDRIADVYPDMRYDDHLKYYHSESTPIAGKIVDHIWGTNHVRHFAEYYDAFFTAMDDAEVISFLSEKAEKYGMDNKKSDAFEIRRNCEDNILRATYTDIVGGRLQGNFGMHHNAMATAAVVLDNPEETKEMIDWIFRSNTDVTGAWWRNDSTGGNFYKQIMNVVSRDGIGDEASPGYNYLWVTNTIPVANTLAGYEGYKTADLYSNPKYMKLLVGEMPLIMCRRGTPQIGDDGGGAAGIGITLSEKDMIKAFLVTGKKEFAQIAYLLNGNNSIGLRGDIFTKYPEDVAKQVRDVIDTHGEYEFLDKSIQLGEYGISILRDGGYYKDTSGNVVDNQRDFWIYYGRGRGHGHPDALNLGMEVFGLNIAPEMGYPTLTSGDEFSCWNHSTISHNTVTVNNESQYGLSIAGKPLHFDDSDVVKVMDIDASNAYAATSIYRRTHVVLKVDDDVSYSVDFFRVRGGNDHIYSFHSQAQEVDLDGLTMRKQESGSYAGSNVAWKTNGIANGYSYMNNVERAVSPGTGEFSADFKVIDSWKLLKQKRDIHLRMTMLNDFNLTEVAAADGPTPDVGARLDSFRYVLARRSGRNLDSLFTTVFEPYDGERYLDNMRSVSIVPADGSEIGGADKAKAVRVEHKDGRVDYICYSSNNQTEYTVDNLFTFKGVIGVYSVKDGNTLVKYVLDGEEINGLKSDAAPAGTVEEFTEDLLFENSIKVKFDSKVDAKALVEKYVHVENGLAVNGVYRICDAENIDDNTVLLDIGDTTLVSGYIDSMDINGGYTHNIAKGNRATVYVPALEKSGITITPIDDMTISVGSKIEFKVQAQSSLGGKITFSGGNMPRGASVDKDTGVFSWVPDSNQLGKYNISINAAADGMSETVYFEIEAFKSIGGGSAGDSAGDGASGGNSGAGGVTDGGNNNTTPGGNSGAGGGGGGGGAPSGGNTGSTENDNKPSDTDKPESGEQGDDTAEEEQFTDLGNHSWAKDAIYALVEKGVVKGTSGNTYSPANNIKRADFAIMLTRAFGITEGDSEQFADVDTSKYYAEELRLAKSAGIVAGVGENKFNPDGEISRQDMMVMLYRALKAQGYELSDADHSVLAEFADAATIADYAKDAVSVLVKDGIIGGSNGKISPLAKANRAEIAVMLSRAVKAD